MYIEEDIKTNSIKYMYAKEPTGDLPYIECDLYRQKMLDFIGEYINTDVKIGYYSKNKSRALEPIPILEFLTQMGTFISKVKKAYKHGVISLISEEAESLFYLM